MNFFAIFSNQKMYKMKISKPFKKYHKNSNKLSFETLDKYKKYFTNSRHKCWPLRYLQRRNWGHSQKFLFFFKYVEFYTHGIFILNFISTLDVYFRICKYSEPLALYKTKDVHQTKYFATLHGITVSPGIFRMWYYEAMPEKN